METAKVDIRKLQVLNDRINQCIDALNQVRLSVHGLSHTAGAFPFPQGAVSPFAQGGVNPWSQGYIPGFSHTGGLSPFAQGTINPFQGYMPGLSPNPSLIGASPAFIPGLSPAINPFLGLAHTSPEEVFARSAWADPLVSARIAQTFPYAQYAVPPVVTIY